MTLVYFSVDPNRMKAVPMKIIFFMILLFVEDERFETVKISQARRLFNYVHLYVNVWTKRFLSIVKN